MTVKGRLMLVTGAAAIAIMVRGFAIGQLTDDERKCTDAT